MLLVEPCCDFWNKENVRLYDNIKELSRSAFGFFLREIFDKMIEKMFLTNAVRKNKEHNKKEKKDMNTTYQLTHLH